MNISKKLVIPSLVAIAGLVGTAGGASLSALSASADTSTTGTSTDATATTAVADTSSTSAKDESKGGHTANGVTETLLTGDTLTKATAAAKAAQPGATVLRAENDAEGATYEVHMQKTDGSEVTVKLDANFKVTATETGHGGHGNGSDSLSSN